MTKPFDATELILRIEAHIRRHKDTIEFARCTARDGSVTIGDLEVRFDEYQVLVGGRPANLTTKEFEIVFLGDAPGQGVAPATTRGAAGRKKQNWTPSNT